MILKIITLLTCLAHTLIPVASPVLWITLSILALAVLLPVSNLRPKDLLRRNTLIILFVLTIALFQLISSVLSGQRPDYALLLITAARILLVYNFVIVSLSWIGRPGFLNLLSRVRSERIMIFLLLLARTVHLFMKLSRRIVYQLQSRLGNGIRDRYLIPRYYVQNLIAGELYSLHLYQAGVVSRIHQEIAILAPAAACRADYTAAILASALMIAGIAAGFPGG